MISVLTSIYCSFSLKIHDSLNHLQKASDILTTIRQANMSHSPEGLFYGLDEVIKHLMKCQSRLVLPCQLSLQALIGSGFTVSVKDGV